MQIMPNRSAVCGVVRSIHPCSDGWGAELVLEVDGSSSPESNEAGDSMRLFSARPERLVVGAAINGEVVVMGDERGERKVLRSYEVSDQG